MLLFLGGGKEDIVQYQSISRRVGVEGEIRWWVADKVAVVLGVVAAKESPRTFAIFSVQIPNLVKFFVLRKNQGAALHRLTAECRSLTHEAMYDAGVVLRKHGGNPVPLGAEFEESEEIVLLIHCLLAGTVIDIDGRNLILVGVGADAEVFESKRLIVV